MTSSAETENANRWITDHDRWLISPDLMLAHSQGFGTIISYLRSCEIGDETEQSEKLRVYEVAKAAQVDWEKELAALGERGEGE